MLLIANRPMRIVMQIYVQSRFSLDDLRPKAMSILRSKVRMAFGRKRTF